MIDPREWRRALPFQVWEPTDEGWTITFSLFLPVPDEKDDDDGQKDSC